MSDRDPEEILAAAQRGDREALEELLFRYRRRLHSYGLRVCKSTEDAEDAVQETLWAAARSIHAFRGTASVTTWLFTIVRNYCFRLVKHHRWDFALDDVLPDLPDDGPSPEDGAAAQETRRQLADALSGLDPIHRSVLLLRDVEGRTAPESAVALGITVDALKSRLHRARGELRRALEERGAHAHPGGA
jgi:RNA polymerase sigma-70 factor (ECF subfamily)